MSLPANQTLPPLPSTTSAPEQLLSADLNDLLGHVHTCWDNERRALSRQLHDSLGSSLTALTMHLSMLIQKMPQDAALQERAAHMKQLLAHIVASNREMQIGLWNDKLEYLGVRVALAETVAEFGQQQGLTTRCSLPDEAIACPRGHAIVLLSMLEEALRNIVAHAQASSVDVIVDDNDEAILLTVIDDGIGLQGQAADVFGSIGEQFGLRTMRARAAYLGGTLTVSSAAGSGVTVSMSLPKTAAAGLPAHTV